MITTSPRTRPTSTTPPYRHHKATGQGYVNLDGRRIYLGRHDDPETERKYHRLVGEWLANGRRIPVAPEHIKVMELAERFLEHAQVYYRRPDGKPSAGLENVKLAVRALLTVYAEINAVEFGPLALRAIRETWIADGLRRTTINKRVGVIKRMFRFGVGHQLIPAAVMTALDAVEGLHKGRSAAKESRVVTAVAQAHIDAVKPYVSRQVWGLIELQLLTGARSGELIPLRRIDIDTTGTVWTATIDRHKTSHHGRIRVLYFGPKAQDVLRSFFFGKAPTDYLFSPADAERERRARQHADRETPLSCGNRPGTNRKADPDVTAGDCYTSNSYRRAIARACELAIADAEAQGKPKPCRWHPHQLRHAAATRIRKELGLEAAQVWLGHANADVTQVYAEVDRARALDIAANLG